MKIPYPSLRRFLLVGTGLCLSAAPLFSQAPDPENFPGVRQALSAQQFSAAGLEKLSPAEREQLDTALREYFSGASKRVSEQAVDRAVKKKQAVAPDLVEGRIVGTVSGWSDRTVFTLDNGQRWRVTDPVKRTFAPVENPTAFIVRDVFGYKMAIGGTAIVRVRRVR